jgi:hypothetical protein
MTKTYKCTWEWKKLPEPDKAAPSYETLVEADSMSKAERYFKDVYGNDHRLISIDRVPD